MATKSTTKKETEKNSAAKVVGKIKVRQIRSGIARSERFNGTLSALGLGRIGAEKVLNASPAVMGMIDRVRSVLAVSNC